MSTKANKTILLPGTTKYVGYNAEEGVYSITITTTDAAKAQFIEDLNGLYKGNKHFVTEDALHLNLSSKFDIPTTGEVEKFTDIGTDAQVVVAINASERALYPKAIKVFKAGRVYNPFACFE